MPRRSTATCGVHYDGLTQLTDDFAVDIEGEFARPSDYAGNPNHYAANYGLIQPNLKWFDTTLAAGWERLGGNGTEFDTASTPA